MATDLCTRRLTKELKALKKDPMSNPTIRVMPKEDNMLHLHYVIDFDDDDQHDDSNNLSKEKRTNNRSHPDSNPYRGGVYHGKLVFPKEYPMKPPGVLMLTPSGRFQPNRRLCLSMSDFHPETWNPMWSVSTILTGLVSFMMESAPTLGSVESSWTQKRRYAAKSLAYNVRDPTFAQLFPDLVERHEQRQAEQHEEERKRQQQQPTTSSSVEAAYPVHPGQPRLELHGVLAGAAGIFAILSLLLAYRCF